MTREGQGATKRLGRLVWQRGMGVRGRASFGSWIERDRGVLVLMLSELWKERRLGPKIKGQVFLEHGDLHINEEGGPCSFRARSVALLFNLGTMVGSFDDATVKDSLRLCPGTPSNISRTEASSVNALLLTGGAAGCCPSLKEAARVILGTIAGAAVDATVIVPVRLWPGTFANVLASCSFVGGVRGAEGILSTGTPARRDALRVVRGTMSGLAVVEGTARARKRGLPFAVSLLLLLPPRVDGLVALEGA